MANSCRKRLCGTVVLIGALFVLGAIALGLARCPAVQFELGYAYEYGNFHGWTPGFSKNHVQAAAWLARAARAGHPRAQYMLGVLYARGWGVLRNDPRAAEWFSRAAENGYGPARYHLGWMYHKGDGVVHDDKRAFRLLEQAAAQGMTASNLALGRFHANGESVPADAVQALKWYTLAVHFAQARPELFDNAKFATRAVAARDAIAKQMDRSSVEQGESLANQWLADHGSSSGIVRN